MRIIFHVDLDAFYAAVEQREHPEWQGLPVVVGADPKQGKGRGVVSTCSYEARKFGIRSAMPISRAYKLCPTAIFVRPHFELYIPTSERIMDILRGHAGRFEQVSIDEAFIDVTNKIGRKDIRELAAAIKKEIRGQEQLSCSIGVGSNKLAAKMASDFRKPDGLTIVEPGKEKEFLSPLPVRKLIGVGEKTELALKGMSISTIGELAALPDPELMQRTFGKFGLYLHEAANGIDESEVEEREGIKSISRNTTFEQDTKDEAMIFGVVDEMLQDSHAALTAANLTCRTVGIRLRFEDFETHTREKTLKEATVNLAVMMAVAKELLPEFLKDRRKVRLVGTRLAGLQQPSHQQQKSVQDYLKSH